jgi:hypothetical protein
VSSLQQLFRALSAGASLRRDAASSPAAGGAALQVVAPTALRQALAALSPSGGAGAMNAVADAAEVLGSMYDAFQAVSSFFRPGEAATHSPIGRMFGIGVQEAAKCARCRKFTHKVQRDTFFHIVSRCASAA